MRGTRRIAALLAALIALATTAPGASALVTIETTGRTGAWALADSDVSASVVCAYEASDLTQLTVSAPRMFSHARRARRVSWQFEVWRAKWWMTTPDQWHLAYRSPIAKARSTRTTSPSFAPRQWAVPQKWRTAYDSFKVRIVMRWYASDGVTQVGRTTVELEYANDGTSVFVGRCVGSHDAPQPPAPGTAAGPAGLAQMTHWRPYWKKFGEAAVRAMIAELTRMHQTGVILSGIESSNRYALPVNVASYLGLMRDAGIKPYLALWIGRFTDAELANTMRAWNAGNGQWAGIVLDVERGLELFTIENRAAAVQAMGRYMAHIRPLTPFIAFSSFGVFSDYPNMPWSEINAHADALMPQVYFRGDEQALGQLDEMQASIDFEAESWSAPPKPIVPVVNDWGDGVDLEQLEAYIEISLARYGAVSGWRLHPNMHEEVKDLWATFPP